MEFAEKMSKVKALEAEIAELVDSLKNDQADAVRKQEFRGNVIDDGSSGGPLIGIVTLSELRKAKSWSPTYFFPEAQAKAVVSRMKSCTTVEDICKAVQEMLKDKRVKIGGEYVYLNNETLKTLMESEIGRYIESMQSQKEESGDVDGTGDAACLSGRPV